MSHEYVKGYVKGQPAKPAHEGHHVMPLKTYLAVFGALMVLTVVTVLVSQAGLGSASLAVAMLVALIKAGFVVGYFMHLKYDVRFYSFVFFSTILFVGIFFLMTFADINTRDAMSAEWGNKRMKLDAQANVPPKPKKIEARSSGAGEIKAPEPAGAK